MKSIMIVLKKELKDMFRDKRTIITGILLPLLILPLVYGIMGKTMSNDKEDIEKNVQVAISSSKEDDLSLYLEKSEGIVLEYFENVDEAIDNGKADVGIIIPDNFNEALGGEGNLEVKLVYDEASQKSMMANGILNAALEEYSKDIVRKKLESNGIDIKILTPFEFSSRGVDLGKGEEKKARGVGALVMSMLLPMFLIMYAASGPLASAIDLGAGEKERATLEPLLTTQVNRTSLLWGKLFAVTIMGIIGVISSLIGLSIAINNNQVMFGSQGMNMGLESLIAIGILTILLTMFFAAIEISISMYARSFKEAQTYLTPITIIAIVLGIGSYGVDIKSMSDSLLFIPVYNVSVCLKEIALGRINYMHIGVTAGTLMLLVVIAVLFARNMFNKESVIFRT